MLRHLHLPCPPSGTALTCFHLGDGFIDWAVPQGWATHLKNSLTECLPRCFNCCQPLHWDDLGKWEIEPPGRSVPARRNAAVHRAAVMAALLFGSILFSLNAKKKSYWFAVCNLISLWILVQIHLNFQTANYKLFFICLSISHISPTRFQVSHLCWLHQTVSTSKKFCTI